MKKSIKPTRTIIKSSRLKEGESIESKMRKVFAEGSPIEEISPMIYTERSEGVLPMYNIKTDKWDEALTAMDKVAQIHSANREKKEQAKILKLKRNNPETGANTHDAGTSTPKG